jgi:hypothetical protein
MSAGRQASALLGLAAMLTVAAAVGLLAAHYLSAGSSGVHPAEDGGPTGGATPGPGPATHRAGGGKGRPGGGAVPFIARLSAEDFGRSAARILPSGAVRAP